MTAADTSYTVTWLEMDSPPTTPPPPVPDGAALIRAHDPALHLFLYLYQTVGADYQWTDMLGCSATELDAYVRDPNMWLMIPSFHGAPGGIALLDFRQPGVCDLAYFGLTPERVGGGRGTWALRAAIDLVWAQGVGKMTINTCTKDHPAALPLYQRYGFRPVRREERRA